jgi:hypothetical protein
MKDIEFLQNLGKPLQREELDLVYVMSSLCVKSSIDDKE